MVNKIAVSSLSWCIIILFLAASILSCTPSPTPTPSQSVSPTPQSAAPTTKAPSTPAPAKTEAATKQAPSPTSTTPYYQGKTIDMVVSSSAGGGTDTVARIIAAFLPGYIPGTPKLIVRNQPGGEGAIANNSFVQKSKPDGLSLIVNADSQVTVAITRPDIAHYDPGKYEHIANIARGCSVLVARKDVLTRLTDPKATPVNLGCREGNEGWTAMALLSQEYLGWNVKWVLGFGGTSEMELSFRRGDIGLMGTNTARTIRALVDEGIAVPMAQEGMSVAGKIVRRPDFPDVPTFDEFMGAKRPSGFPWQAYAAARSATIIDKWVSTTPGTPPNIVNTLTDAARAMSKDPQFDDRVKKMVSEIYSMGIGQDTTKVIKDFIDTPREAFEYVTSLQVKFDVISK